MVSLIWIWNSCPVGLPSRAVQWPVGTGVQFRSGIQADPEMWTLGVNSRK